MTDSSANGPSAHTGATPQATQQPGDVTGTLAELERKLRELERELTSIGRRRDLTTAVTVPDTATGLPTPPSGRLVDEAIEPSTPAAPLHPAASPTPVAPLHPAASPTPVAPLNPAASPTPVASPPPFASPTPVAPPLPVAPSTPVAPAEEGQPVKFMRPLESARTHSPPEQARWSGTASVEGAAQQRPAGQMHPSEANPESEAHAESDLRRESEPPSTLTQQERLRPSEAQLASLAELRRFRDRLERFARELAAEYDALLGRVMSGLTSASPPGSSPPSVPASPSPTPIAGAAPAFTAETTPPATSPPRENAPASGEDALFEGRVELGVGPFYDIGSLSAFERRLSSLPYVVEASVRRFEASHAVVDLRLAAPVALVRELRRTTDTDFSIREVADGRILLTFDES